MARAVRSGSRADFLLLGLCAAVSLLLNVPTPLREPVSAALRRSVLAPFISLQKRAELTRAAFEAHDALAMHADSLASRALAATALQGENDRLRRLLGLGSRLGWGFVPAEALHEARTSDDFTLALTAGANAGVKRFSPVVAPEGLVGMVTTVDPQTSLAITWSHPDFRVSAKTVDGTVFGIVAAHLGAGVDRYLLEMRGVAFRSTLKPGTLIVSSGVGGVFPPGIPVGTVVREVKTAEGWARTYLMQPSVQPSSVGAVMILHADRAQAGVESAWATIVNADSGSRRVAAAGDSMARDSVSVETARAAAARDSAARAAAAAAPPSVAPADSARGTVPTAPATTTAPARAVPPVRRDSTRAAAVPPVRRDSARAPVARLPVARAPAAVPRPAATTPADTARRDSVRRAARAAAARAAAARPAPVAPRDSGHRTPR